MRPARVVRSLDPLGRVVVPKELRSRYGFQPETPIEISVDGENIVLTKFVPRCTFCQMPTEDLEQFKGKMFCSECKESIQASYR